MTQRYSHCTSKKYQTGQALLIRLELALSKIESKSCSSVAVFLIIAIIYTLSIVVCMNIPLVLIPLSVGLCAQLLKALDDAYDKKRFSRRSLYASWWFPSVHSAFTASVSTMTGLEFWFDSGIYAVAFIFSALFWYDAVTLRYQAWQHASSLNKINKQLYSMLADENTTEPVTETTNAATSQPLTAVSLLEAATRLNAPTLLKERLGHKLYEVIWGIIVWASLSVIIVVYIFWEPRWIAR